MRLRFSLLSVFVCFAVVILVSASYGDIDPNTCVGVWLFDAGKGDTAIDSSGNDLDGTIFNGPEWVDGKFGKALKFDGTDDYINLPTMVSDGWEGLTLMAWMTIELLPNELPESWDEIIGSNQDIYDMYLDRGANELRVKVTTTGGAERPGIPAAELVTDEWFHVAGIYDGAAGQMKIYMNGELMDTHNLTGVVNGTQFSSIGAQGGPNGPFTDYHHGLIDEVALFNVALSEQDLKAVMNNGLSESLNIATVVLTGKLTAIWADIKTQQ